MYLKKFNAIIHELDENDTVIREKKGVIINCIFCESKIVQESIKGCKFICDDCCDEFEEKILNLLKTMDYGDSISHINIENTNKFNIVSNKTIKVVYNFNGDHLSCKYDTELFVDYLKLSQPLQELNFSHLNHMVKVSVEMQKLQRVYYAERKLMDREVEFYTNNLQVGTFNFKKIREMYNKSGIRKEILLDNLSRYCTYSYDKSTDMVTISEIYDVAKPIVYDEHYWEDKNDN